MRILAFYFAEEARADAALASLSSNGIGDAVAEVAPLVVDGLEGTILALSVDAEEQETAERLARRHGGRLVADVPEEWTRPTVPPAVARMVGQRTDAPP